MNRPGAMLLLGLVVLFSGCSTLGSRQSADADAGRADAGAESLQRLGNARTGEVLDLPSDSPFDTGRATVSSEYVAASGRLCRRATATASGRQRTLCKQDDGTWQLIRSLDPAASLFHGRDMSVADAEFYSDSGTAGVQAADMISVPLRSGESLWHFAVRTTGDGHNWSRIAVLNDIPDPDVVDPGLRLVVPEALLKDER